MKPFRLILLLIWGIVAIYAYYHTTSSAQSTDPTQSAASSDTAYQGSVPKKVLKILEIIRNTGSPPEGYVGGRVFQNREQRLPPDGDYREFDVDPHEGGRNAERIVMDWQTKKAWYTSDHYQTFIPLP